MSTRITSYPTWSTFCRLFALLSIAMILTPNASAISWDDAGNSASKLWDDNGNWSPDGDPDALDVFIGNFVNAANDTTLMDRAYSINSLTITNGADVVNSTDNGATNDWELLVNGATSVTGAGSSIILYGGDPDGLDTNTLAVSGGGSIILNSGSASGTAVLEVDSSAANSLNLGSGGTIIGTGRIDLDSSPVSATSLMLNNGTITANTNPIIIGFAPAAGTLQIAASSANARFDWDGGGSGVLQVNGNQTLDIDVQPGAGAGTDAFSGTMNLGTGSTLDIEHAWSMDSGTINANTAAFGLIIIGQDPNPGAAAKIDGANWTMTGGTINVDDGWDSLQLDSQLVASGGTIANSGTMIFNGGATIQSGVDFNMIGADASLVVNSAVNIDTPDFDLDGSQLSGNVTTINAGGNLDLDLGAGADVSYGHTINMNGGELDFTSTAVMAWQLNSAGEINADGGVTSTINSAGETFQISGDINVGGDSGLNINSTSEYFASANVLVKAGGVLNHTSTTYNGGSFTGEGVFKPGSSTIASPTTWGVDTVDLDDGNHTIDSILTINTNSIDDAGDGFDTNATIADAGQLNVNIGGGGSWTVDSAGDINYNGNASNNTFLTGSDIQMNGTMTIVGDGTTTARIILGASGTININTLNEPLRLNGGDLNATNRIEGGTITGVGRLGLNIGRAIVGFGDIDSDIQFIGNGNRVTADDGILNINGAFIGQGGSIGTDDTDGILNVANSWNTNSALVVRLMGGEVRGANITNDSSQGIVGNGLVSARVNNNSRITSQNGTLVIETAANNNDWDGTTDNGLLYGQSGTLELRDTAGFVFDGTVQANSGSTVFANGFELRFAPASTLDLNGGTYRSTDATEIAGTVDVAAGPDSTLQITGTTVFAASSNTTLNGDLVLNNTSTVVESGATFSGGASLVNSVGRTLTLHDGADVDVLIENNGTLSLGASPGQTTGLDFEQTASGTWDLELGGTGLNDYDRMTLTGVASLAGELDISTIGGYTPTLGNTFSIILAGSVVGTFDNVTGSPGAGLEYDVAYNAGSVILSVIAGGLAGDLDGDGFVGINDLNIVLANWNQNVPPANPLADPSGDGFVGIDDLNEVLGNWNAGTPPADLSQTQIPEPTTGLFATAGVISLVFRRRRHKMVC